MASASITQHCLWFSGFQLQGLSGPLVAQLGGSVLLPCAAESPLPLEELEVEWRRADSGALLHLFQEGEERPESQDRAYRGRVAFFPVEMAKGNFSILLKNVSEEDIGVYSCKVFTEHEAEEVKVDVLKVGKFFDSSPPPHCWVLPGSG
ncbi:V-set domain-containing T-cell activation inhibitor 1-like [Engraulis encrasicolus]|uniref:V-set domain-containing T-cell activation inhibitor 1-like n=1 Tax=Engraulis encrasicolus TaxID=184585 RepID=UPI002FD28D97